MPPADDPDAAYLALCTRDARFDGRLFVGVTSTGIYCRPVCRVRTPRRENCRFFGSRALAEAAAFRPCLKCRPEIAPGLSQMDSSRSLADSAALMMDEAVHDGAGTSLPAIAERLGVTDRHLRRIFQAAHGVAPLDYLTTQRLLLAKQLLTDTALPVTQVALASGFESLRRFNAAFAERYRLNPTQLRRQGAGRAAADKPLRLAWRPPFDVEALLGFFARRQVRGVEQVEGLEAAPHAGLDAPRRAPGRLDRRPLRARGARVAPERVAEPGAGARRRAAAGAPGLRPRRRPGRDRHRAGHAAGAAAAGRAPARHAGRLRDRRARDPGPAGHGEGRAHAGAAPGGSIRHADRHPLPRR